VVSAEDLDGDGDLDLLSSAYHDPNLAWHENDGSGSGWTLHTISLVSDYIHSVTSADIDGDGDGDVVAAHNYGDTVSWYENDGAGGAWTLHTVSSAVDGARSVVVADVDGDGDPDLLSASGSDDKIAWHENDGSGVSWTLHTISLAADDAQAVFTADIDGDGDIDALSASENDDKIAWYENTAGDGSSWAPHTISLVADRARAVIAGDVDGDGDLDALSASRYDDKIAWYENTAGDGSSWSLHTISTIVDSAWSVFAADVDGDGDLDALSASAGGDQVLWHENEAPGDGSSWALHTLASAINNQRSVFAADLDGDGDLDAVSASYGGVITWYPNLGTRVFVSGFGSETPDAANLACWSGSGS
jgi:hypothetical protein